MENIFFLVLLASGRPRPLAIADRGEQEERRSRAARRYAAKASGGALAPRQSSALPRKARKNESAVSWKRSVCRQLCAAATRAAADTAACTETKSERQFLPVDPFPVPRPRRPEQPPPVAVPTTSSIPAAPPPLPQSPPPLPTAQTTMFGEQPRQPAARSSTAADFEVQEVGDATVEEARTSAAGQKGRQAAPPRTAGIAARLATAEGLRDAVILREIFGPPRSMQPIEPGR